jgi:hypothetical protein
MITKKNISAVIRKQLQTFNNEGVTISDDTILSEVLDENDGLRSSISSMKLFQGIIMWTIVKNGGTQVKFPSDWMDMNVTELAEFIMSKQEA